MSVLMTFPTRFFVEPTTRCNLRCELCVKQSAGLNAPEADLSLPLYRRLLPAFTHAEAIILNGVGEPLLNPELTSMVSLARGSAPDSCWIGFQSNGQLLDASLAAGLVDAGLDGVCFSVDAVTGDLFRQCRAGGDLERVIDALGHMSAASRRQGRTVDLGLEFVARRDNFEVLPQLVDFALEHGVTFLLVSHVLPYAGAHAAQALFVQSTDKASALFASFEAEARSQGLSLRDYAAALWKSRRTAADEQLVALGAKLRATAEEQGVFVHLEELLAEDAGALARVEAVFARTRALAEAAGIRLKLPALRPRHDRRCDFLESGGMFIDAQGAVSPCYPYWRSHCSHIFGRHKMLEKITFGSLLANTPQEIWRSAAYARFREQAASHDYPVCTNCNLFPCNYIDGPDFENDCYTNTVPCCDCLWCMGVFTCLGQDGTLPRL